MTINSGLIGGYLYAEGVSPLTNFSWWDIEEISPPTGVRHLESGHPAFVKFVDTATPLEFRNIELNFISGIVPYYNSVECLTFKLNNDRFFVANMRLWLPSGSAIIPSGRIEYSVSGTWVYNAILPSGYGTIIDTSLPATQNVNRQDGFGSINGTGDNDVTQFIYLSLSIPSGYSLGRYGYGGTGTLAFKLTYDYYQKI